jgi:hypothetical protein
MPSNDREVFEHFLNDPDASLEIAHLAYAAYASSKYDWAAHFETRKGQPPSSEEMDEWIASQPPSRLDEILEAAKTTFELAATAYMAKRIEEEKDRAVRDSILSQVEGMARRVEVATSFKATWLPNLLLGVVASFAFALIVLGGAAIYRGDPSIFALFKDSPPAPTPPVVRPD